MIVTDFDQLAEVVTAYKEFDATAPCLEWGRCTDDHGYGMVRVGRRVWRTHRLAMSMVLGRDLLSSECVLHRCDNPPCLWPGHLFLGTKAQNNEDRDRKGRHRPFIGVEHPRAKLTEEDVLDIRRLREEGLLFRELAEMFEISVGHAHSVVSARSWSHL